VLLLTAEEVQLEGGGVGVYARCVDVGLEVGCFGVRVHGRRVGVGVCGCGCNIILV